MGILRNKEQRYEPIRIEDFDDEAVVNEYGNYLFDSDFSDSEPEAPENKTNNATLPSVEIYRRKKPRRFRRNYGPIEVVDGLPVKRNMGAQKWRRVQNAKLIMEFTDMQDVCFDGSDLVEETITAFTRLLRDEAKMKIWNEFIEMDEANQAKMIKKIEEEEKQHAANKAANKPGTSKKAMKGDKEELRKHHPAFSAEACFQRLDAKIRKCLLKRRYLQFDYLAQAEKNLRGFFNEFGSGVYFEDIACRVKRFYMHAVAQFLRLKSQTIDGADSKKLVQVENNLPSFAPPDVFLGVFLKKKRRSRRVSQNGNAWNDDDFGCDI